MNLDRWISPTLGHINFKNVINDIRLFIMDEDFKYDYYIGTDSMISKKGVCYVTAIVVHKVGKCGRYYYTKEIVEKDMHLPMAVRVGINETMRSIDVAEIFVENMKIKKDIIEIHLDIGNKGETKELIQQSMGMTTAYGFNSKIKPDSPCASIVSDKHTKNF